MLLDDDPGGPVTEAWEVVLVVALSVGAIAGLVVFWALGLTW